MNQKYIDFLELIQLNTPYDEARKQVNLTENEIKLMASKLTIKHKELIQQMKTHQYLKNLKSVRNQATYLTKGVINTMIRRIELPSIFDIIYEDIDLNTLTNKQFEILNEMRKGNTVSEVALIINSSSSVIKTHLEAIKIKHSVNKTGKPSTKNNYQSREFVRNVNVDELTEKKRNIICELRAGKNVKDIAENLNLKKIDIYSHLKSIHHAYELTNQ